MAIALSGEPLGELQVQACPSRGRLLQSGDTSKNDPDDALPVAVAALRSPDPWPVTAGDHAVVLKVWAKRHRDLGSLARPGRLPAARGAGGRTSCWDGL